MTSTPSSLDIRPAVESDVEEIVDVCSAALGWKSPDFDTSLFRWKHFTNAFGRSLILVAADPTAPEGAQIRAVRPFMRWRFALPDGTTVAAARAVDTATLPQAQGQGLFRTLTLAGLDLLEDEGCGFVFNTPNAKSLAGYLKMGWQNVGGVPLGFGLSSLRSAKRIATSRTAADKPSIPTPELGLPIDDGLATLAEPLFTAAEGVRTDHTIDTLRWRYLGGPIAYRFIPTTSGSGIIVRLRKRGEIRELVVAQILGDAPAAEVSQHARDAMRSVDADICVGPATLNKTATLSRLGPTLALRPLQRSFDSHEFAWSPGDIELF